MRRWLLPEHIEDVLPAEARAIERLRRAILDLFEVYGYELVAPPLLEYVESLLSGTGRDLDLVTFRLVDQLSGRMMGVRADHTPQVARIDAHLLNRQGVTRLCYCGSVLHSVPAGMTKMREPIQIGAELYGHAGIEADVEIVRLMIEALEAAGLQKLHVDIGHPGVYRALIENTERDETLSQGSGRNNEELFHAVQQKDAPAARELGGDAFAALTELNGGVDVLARARKELPRLPDITKALDMLEKLAARCASAGVEISVDLAELGGFNYESGLVFAAFTPGSPDAIARGGRYDEVGASFGRARPATGFTMDLRQVAALVRPSSGPSPGGEGGRDRILAPSLEDKDLDRAIEQLRAKGEIVIIDLPGHESARGELNATRKLEKKDGKWRVT